MTRNPERLRAYMFAAGFILGMLLVAINIVSLAILLKDTQQASTDRQQILRLVEQLDDCLTPVRPDGCYEQQQQRQADVVRQLQEVDIFLIACARENPAPQAPDAIIACVERYIGRDLNIELSPQPAPAPTP